MSELTRRSFLAGSGGLGVLTLAGIPGVAGVWPGTGAALTSVDSPDRTFIRNIPFIDSHDRLERVYGAGLDGRFRQDLSLLTPQTLITPNERFFIRTRCPDLIDLSVPWTIRITGRIAQEKELILDNLLPMAEPMGVHLLECSGSGRGGLISAARFTGIPFEKVLGQVEPSDDEQWIMISGFDQHSDFNPDYDERGCSWIFTREQLTSAGAFLAITMNGKPLSRDHGFPVRLVVPRWYGCCCPKWVNAIRYVRDSAASTNHMRTFAGRTHQDGIPDRARDFKPATIGLSAMAIRVEQWSENGESLHRVVGIIWGGARTTDKLVIRFNRDGDYVPVEDYTHETNRTWSLWSHWWRPPKPGRYEIRLQVDDDSIIKPRLDRGSYRRRIDIS